MASALIISPENLRASSSANFDLPAPVAPKTTKIGFNSEHFASLRTGLADMIVYQTQNITTCAFKGKDHKYSC